MATPDTLPPAGEQFTTSSAEHAEPVGISFVGVSELHESPDNPRTITDQRFADLMHSMEKDPGMLIPRPLIATTDGEVVAGNMRLRAARKMLADSGKHPNFTAWYEHHGGIPTWLGPLSEQRKREWMLRDNAGYGEWEAEALTELVAEYVQGEDADRRLLGFDTDQLDRILGEQTGGGGDAPENPPPPEMWGVVVECESEAQQSELLERLDGEGFNVRSLL